MKIICNATQQRVSAEAALQSFILSQPKHLREDHIVYVLVEVVGAMTRSGFDFTNIEEMIGPSFTVKE